MKNNKQQFSVDKNKSKKALLEKPLNLRPMYHIPKIPRTVTREQFNSLKNDVENLKNSTALLLLWNGDGPVINVCHRETNPNFDEYRVRLTDPKRRLAVLNRLQGLVDQVAKPDRLQTEEEKQMQLWKDQHDEMAKRFDEQTKLMNRMMLELASLKKAELHTS